jgi:ankyrin repeat protein
LTLSCARNSHSSYRIIHGLVIDGDEPAVAADLAAYPGDLELHDDAGQTPLHLAAIHCRTNVLATLLAKGAKANARMHGGGTPLHLAAQQGCADAVRMLLAAKAAVNPRDGQGRTPLEMASQWNQDAVVELLREHGGTR